MAHFARLDENNVVMNVIVVSDDELVGANTREAEAAGVAFCNLLQEGNWVQTSYNNRFRGKFAGIGYAYDPVEDVFIQPVEEEDDD